jgi:ABC-type phosphate transport system ATPase subunit
LTYCIFFKNTVLKTTLGLVTQNVFQTKRQAQRVIFLLNEKVIESAVAVAYVNQI